MLDWFRNLKIRNKMLASFGLIVIVSAVAMGFALYSIKQMAARAQDVVREVEELAVYEEFQTNVSQQEEMVRNYFLTGDESYLAKWDEYQQAALAQVNVGMDTVENDEEGEEIQELAENLREREQSLTEALSLYRAGDQPAAIALLVDDDAEESGQIQEKIGDVTADARADLGEATEDAARQAQSAFVAGLIGVLLAILLGAGFSLALASGITRPIILFRDMAEKISMGGLEELPTRVPVTSGDEIGDLAGAFERLITALRFLASESDQKEEM